jgi:hypothetical protein
MNSAADKVLARIQPPATTADKVDLEMMAPHFGRRPRATPKVAPAEFPTARLTPLESGLDKLLNAWNKRARDND